MFVTMQNQVAEDFSDIDIQLNRRADLIDQLVQTVKGYAKHERSVFEDIAKARSSLNQSQTIKEKEAADKMYSSVKGSLIAVVEDYPKLKANESYKELMDNMKDTEDKIAAYRETYNRSVKRYNNAIQVFPNIVASATLQFRPADFFEFNAVST